MRNRVQLLAASLLPVLFPVGAWAADGVLLVQTVDTGAGTTLTSSQIRVEPTRIRTEIDDGSGRQQVVIFDGTKEVLYVRCFFRPRSTRSVAVVSCYACSRTKVKRLR